MKTNNFIIIFSLNFCTNLSPMSLDFTKLHDEVKSAIKRACGKNYKKKCAECAIAEVLVEELVELDPKNVNMRDSAQRTLLMHAVIYGPCEIVKYLLEKKADINGQDSNGWTVLMHATKLERVDVVTLLMKYNPDLTKKCIDGSTIWDILHSESKQSK